MRSHFYVKDNYIGLYVIYTNFVEERIPAVTKYWTVLYNFIV